MLLKSVIHHPLAKAWNIFVYVFRLLLVDYCPDSKHFLGNTSHYDNEEINTWTEYQPSYIELEHFLCPTDGRIMVMIHVYICRQAFFLFFVCLFFSIKLSPYFFFPRCKVEHFHMKACRDLLAFGAALNRPFFWEKFASKVLQMRTIRSTSIN